eukprot:4096614-Karenia_brevis.AAC.1
MDEGYLECKPLGAHVLVGCTQSPLPGLRHCRAHTWRQDMLSMLSKCVHVFSKGVGLRFFLFPGRIPHARGSFLSR